MAVTAIIVGVAVSGVSAIASYNAQSDAADAQDELNKQQQKVYDAQAVSEEERGIWEAKQIRDKARKLRATQEAGFAGSGVKLFAGTSLDVTEETSILSEVDALTALKDSTNRAKQLRMSGAIAGTPTTRTFSAASTGLSIIGDGLSAYGSYRKINNVSTEGMAGITGSAGSAPARQSAPAAQPIRFQ